MPLSPHSLPELASLPAAARRKVVRACLAAHDLPRDQRRLLLYILGLLLWLVVIALLTIYGKPWLAGRVDRKAMWMMDLLALALIVAGPLVGYLLFLRATVRQRLKRIFHRGRATRCVNCHYDLRGTDAANCPECGEPVCRLDA